MSNHPTHEEAVALCLAAQKGDVASRNELVLRNIAFAKHRARFYASINAGEEDDLFQIAMVGMIKAVEIFDPSLGFEFITVAGACVRQEIQTETYGRRADVRTPRNVVIAITHNQIHNPENPTKSMGNISSESIEAGIRTRSSFATGTAASHDMLATRADTVTALAESNDEVRWVIGTLAKLTPDRRYVVCHRHGLMGCPMMSFDEISKQLGASASWARTVYRQAIGDILAKHQRSGAIAAKKVKYHRYTSFSQLANNCNQASA